MIFKVGDKVKINCTDRWYSAKDKFNLNGQEYRIIKIRKPRCSGDEFVYSLDVPDAESCSIYSNPSIWLWSKKEFELVKPKFDIKNYPGKYVMHVTTQEQDEIFRKYLHSLGKRWYMGNSYLDYTHFHLYKAESCYNFNNGTYEDLDYYEEHNYTILYFEDFDWSDFTMQKEFTKADLKNGDFVKLRDGSIGIVLADIGAITFGRQIIFINAIRDDLTDRMGDHNDIMIVRRPNRPLDCTYEIFNRGCGELVYERKEVEEMTLEEVCKALGKEIKIVKK